ncbi:MAG TPA: PspC domain-containing protein [Candidatus Acidoferrales bacterium]|jgi:phage shock protein C|nr:PspC domain-containing protein [Candidatus Acidoferrales bacterium]
MYCTRCGQQMPAEAAFCSACGANMRPTAAKRLMRSRVDRKIAGVAAGVAEYFDLDPTLVRVLWVVCLLFAGTGGLLYLILWIVLPEEPMRLPMGAPAPPPNGV